jgi:hypothetical protein
MKKILMFALLCMIGYMVTTDTFEIHADSYASVIGFAVNDTNYQHIHWVDTEYIEVYGETSLGNRLYGVAKVDVGYYKFIASDTPVGFDFYAVLIRVIMNPVQYTWKCGLFKLSTCTNTGVSEYLSISSNLKRYSTNPNNTLDEASPVTKSYDTSYSVGIGAEYDGAGNVKMGVSGSVSFSVRRLIVRGEHDFINQIFRATYDYKSPVWPWDDWRYERDPSKQLAVFMVRSPKTQTWFSNRVDVTAKFEMLIPNSDGYYSLWSEQSGYTYHGFNK